MANDKRFIVKNGLSGPNVRFANGSNTTAYMELSYAANGSLIIGGNSAIGALVTISDGSTTVLTVNGDIAFGTSGISVNSTYYEATANNASYAYGKQESQLYVANAVFATSANNTIYHNGKLEGNLNANSAVYLNGKQESQLYVANAVFATTANNSLYAFGKQEGQLAANSAVYANAAIYLNGKQESQLYVANAVYATSAGSVAGGTVTGTVSNANNSNYLNGANSQYFANATNLTTGTVSESLLPYRMNQNVRTTDSVTFANGTFTGNVTVGGDLILSGNLYSTNVQSLSVADPLLHLGANNPGDTFWGGFIVHYNGSGNTNNHTGLIRNPMTKDYILMSTYGDENAVANNAIDPTATSFTYANLAVLSIKLGNATSFATLNGNNYSGTANNATYAYGKQESQLSVAIAANATFATTANNSLYAYGKQESQLYVANAVFATTANNSLYAYGKQESQLYVANAVFATSANNALYAYGKQESQLYVANSANSSALQGATWQSPLGIGTVTANTGAFTTLITSGVTTHNANVVFNAALIANSSAGIAGQVLSSNGTSVYWTNANNISGTVANANNASYLNGKQEGQLSVANAVFATTANNALYAYGKQESQLTVANSAALQGATWQAPLGIGAVTPNTANFTVANTTNYLSVKNIAHYSGDSNTTTAVAQVQISSFSANTYGSAKIYIQATETTTTRRHVTEILVVHDNSVASATEYGMLYTGANPLATYDVDIVSNNVRVLATPASANTIAFRVSEQLFLI